MSLWIGRFDTVGKLGRGPFWAFLAAVTCCVAVALSAQNPPAPPESGPTTPVLTDASDVAAPSAEPKIEPDSPHWERLDPAERPSPRFRAKAVYATDRQRLLLVGGYLESKDYCNETWEYDGREWKKMPIGGPPAGASFSLAYDQRRGVAVFFGGARETWEYNGKAWRKVTPVNRPPVIGFGTLAYDLDRRVCVLFGGEIEPAEGEVLPRLYGETWEYDGYEWLQRDFTGPEPRKYHQMVYDAARQRFVLFGGFSKRMLNDTWELRDNGWRKVETRRSPSPRRGFAMTYDPIGRRTLLFGGYPGGDELWEFDGADWTRIMTKNAPPPREDPVLEYIPTTRHVLMFGGLGRALLDDMWEFHRGPVKAALPVPPLELPGAEAGVVDIPEPEPPVVPTVVVPITEAPDEAKGIVVPKPIAETKTTGTALAELRFESVGVSPTHMTPTTVLAFRGKLLNTGGKDAQCWIECWLSLKREALPGGQLLCRSQRAGVPAGGAYDLSLIMRMPYEDITPGRYYLVLQVDRLNEVPEADESNNLVVLEAAYTIEK